MSDLERVLQATPLTLSQQWYEAGVAVDPGTVTVGITRADGTELVAPATATSGSGTAARTYNLTTTHTALLDTLTVTWTSTLKGTITSTVEVVGGFLFSIAEFRSLGSAYANTTNYPTATVADMRTTVEQALEDACSVAFVPRYSMETVNGVYGGLLSLRWARVRSIRTVTVDDVAGTPADYVALREGMVYASSTWWTAGYGNVTVGYEHGYDSPPMRIKRAALILAKRWITPGSADDRAINVTNDSGTYALFQAGVRGHLFDVPEVQAAVDQYNLSVSVV
jgi:hypothetical protein